LWVTKFEKYLLKEEMHSQVHYNDNESIVRTNKFH
jgi:hypothetical protein